MKAILKRSPILLLTLLFVLFSASYIVPATEVEVPSDVPVVKPAIEAETPVNTPVEESAVDTEAPADTPAEEPAIEAEAPADTPAEEPAVEAEAPTDIPAEEPAVEAETPANSSADRHVGAISGVAIVPTDEVEPPAFFTIEHPKLVFWEEYDCKMHLDPHCMTGLDDSILFSRLPDDTPFTGCFRGTVEEAKAAGHTEWCQTCYNWKNFCLRGLLSIEERGQDDEKFMEKYGNPFLGEDGNTLIGKQLVEVDGKWYFED